MTEEEKKEIAGRVAGILSSKFKKELLDEIKALIPNTINDVKTRVKDELEPKIDNILKNFEDFLKERNINQLLENEARSIMLRALRNRAEDWARKCVSGVKFSFDEIYNDD